MAQSLDWTMEGLDNPLLLQEKLLDRFEETTDSVVVDTNNPACVLMESFASTAAGLVRSIEDHVRPAIYPARANNAEDLYKHVSDYDYVDVFASPASTTIQMIVDKVYVMHNSVAVEGVTYKKMRIPRTTLITIGDHTFGLYYPIEIRSNVDNGSFTVVYDTTEENPLHSLSTNILEYDIRKYDGHELVFIKIPVYQFEITTHQDVLVDGTGFKRDLEYKNKFYAIRAVSNVLQNPGHDESEEDKFEKEELALCVSGQSYDPQTPTLVFTPDLENNVCTVEIPYVYFSNGLISGDISIDLYTSEGNINYTIPTDTTELCTIDMFSQMADDAESVYVEPFRQMPGLSVLPLGTNVIGGSDGMDFSTLKRRVIDGTLKSKTLQTPDDIDAYFANEGYITTKYRDGITDRIFIAHATVRNSSDEVVGADCIGTLFDFRETARKDYDTITQSDTNTFTVLPSTLYKLDTERGICVPLTTAERSLLEALVPAEKVEAFNNGIYTLSPFHLQVDISSKYPTTVTYDMTNTAIQSSEFIASRDDTDVSCQLILNSSSFETLEDSGSSIKKMYRLTFQLSRSGLDDYEAVVSDDDMGGTKNFRVIVGLKNDDGVPLFAEATFVSRTDDFDVFVLDIPSSYKFKQANNNHTVELHMSNMANAGMGEDDDFYLISEARVMLCIRGDINGVAAALGPTNRILETDFISTATIESMEDWYALAEHKLMLRFGSPVNELDQRINLAYNEMEYMKYDTTRFLTLDYPIYKRKPDGCLDVIIETLPSPIHVLTSDTTCIAGKTYYTKSGSTYTPVASPTGNPQAQGWYEQTNKKVVIQEKYPEGTMTCLTKTMQESFILNKKTRDNYVGCELAGEEDWDACTAGGRFLQGTKYFLRYGAGTTSDPYKYLEADVTYGAVIPASPTYYVRKKITSSTTVGTQLSISNAPIVPRFSITNTIESSEGDIPAKGTYELGNAAAKRGGLSGTSDVWYKTGLWTGFVGTSWSEDFPPNIHATSSLLYVFEQIFTADIDKSTEKDSENVIDASSTADPKNPLESIKANVGTFILVNNDESGAVAEAPIMGTILDLKSDFLSKVYYCYEATDAGCLWACVAQGQVPSGITTTARKYFLSYLQQNYDGSEGVRIMFGGSYVGEFPTELDNGDIEIQRFVSFVNTTKLGEYTIPNFKRFYADKCTEIAQCTSVTDFDESHASTRIYFTQRTVDSWYSIKASGTQKAYEVAKTLYEAGTDVFYVDIVAIDLGWTNYVNKWPWDDITWWELTTASISVKGVARVTNAQRAIIDEKFATLFDNTRLHPYCAYTSNDFCLDSNGNLIEKTGGDRFIKYLIDMVQLDAKLDQTTQNKTTKEFPGNITNVLRTHFDNLANARNNMFTNTRLFFEPVKSLSTASFDIGDDRTEEIQLDISVAFKIYVTAASAADDELMADVRRTIISIIDNEIEKNRGMNCAEVAAAILNEIGDTVLKIDIGGINGDPTLQTIKCIENGVQPHLGHALTILDDEHTIDVDRALTLTIAAIEE